jgi:mono/diheme cytochrome c family protein
MAVIISCKTQFATTKINYTHSESPIVLERGKMLTFTICAGCHYDGSVNKFIGKQIKDVPGIAGKVYSANLTNSRSNGITPHYTDAELKYLLKTGVSKDGRFISYMLRPNMADEDINAIIAYLRSNDDAVAAANTTVGLTHYTLLGKMFMSATAKPLPYKPDINRPAESDPVALGRYLVDNIGCFHCHSKSLMSLNYLYPERSKGYLAGGFKLKGANGNKISASNITPDKETGIGNYTKAEFIKAIKDGQAPDRKLHPPMPKFQHLPDEEVDAIYSYLQTVPAVYHKVGK